MRLPIAPTALTCGLLMITSLALAGCGDPPIQAAACPDSSTLAPTRAMADAQAALKGGDRQYVAVYGRYALELPGASGADVDGARVLEYASPSGPCEGIYQAAVAYARRYNETLDQRAAPTT